MKARVLILLTSLLVVLNVHANNDLTDYINQIKSRPAGTLEPIPDFIIPKVHRYSTENLRDPFEQTQNTDDYQPDLSRTKEPLESYTLDALMMVGFYTRRNPTTKKIEYWALIAAPDKTIYPVTVGNYIGRHLGRIQAITQKEIILVEEIKTHTGWGKRPASLILSDKQR